MSALPPDRPAGYLALLVHNAPFRRLFLARVISLLGDWFNTLAVLALLREVGGDAALAFGGVLILKTAPSVLVTPLAGALIDRLPRKGLMIGTDLVRAALVGGLFAVPLPDAPGARVALLYGILLLLTAARAVGDPTRTAVLPDLVRRQDLVTANAMSAAAWSLMFTVGTALGGIVTAGFGWRVALVVDALSFLASAALVVSLPVPPTPTASRPAERSFVAGLRYLLARPRLWTLALVKTGWSLAGAITLVLTILGERVYASAFAERLPGDPALLGVTALYMARGVGTGVGPILSRWLAGADPRRSEVLIGVAFLWGALFYALLGTTPGLWGALACVLLAHFGGATVWVFSTVRLQASTPTQVRGRVFACEQGGFMLSMAASTLLYSLVIDRGSFALTAVAASLGLPMALAGCAWFLRCALLGFGAPEERP